jgi:hypothetical protein
VAQKIGKEVEEAVMTTADMLREEGVQKGIKKGQREVLLKLLSLRFGELPEAVVAQVNTSSPAQLDLWVERILSASTLADVLADR